MGILASLDPNTYALEILRLCSADGAALPLAPQTSLEGMFWAFTLGGLRLRYVLALWGSVSHPNTVWCFDQLARMLCPT